MKKSMVRALAVAALAGAALVVSFAALPRSHGAGETVTMPTGDGHGLAIPKMDAENGMRLFAG